MNVHQLLSGAGPYDAITTEALVFRSHFRDWGWGGSDHAARIAPGLSRAITDWQQLRARDGDVLLIHHSAGVPHLDRLLALPNPKLLLYHNITPAAWLWGHAPLVAMHCAIGHGQLDELVAVADVAAADSEFNAAELRARGAEQTIVIPLLIDRHRLGAPAAAPSPDGSPPTILFVGRLSPHKRQDELIRCFALHRRHHAPDARLVLVGDPLTPQYGAYLERLADDLAPGAVSIESGLAPQALGDRYRTSDAFVCLSEHEGFCIPLLEAFHFGVPVVARTEGAIPETVGDAALLVEDRDRALVAELLHLVISDESLRAELRRRGEARLAAFSPEHVARRLRDALEAAAARRRPAPAPAEPGFVPVS